MPLSYLIDQNHGITKLLRSLFFFHVIFQNLFSFKINVVLIWMSLYICMGNGIAISLSEKNVGNHTNLVINCISIVMEYGNQQGCNL